MKHILLVDDDQMNLVIAKHALDKDYRVTSVTSGMEALHKLEEDTPDLILMDIEMPEMDGMETTRRIKANAKWSKIPLIFLTADSDPITESECLKLGADDFIVKPFVPIVMTGRISRILELNELKTDLELQLEKKSKQIEMVTLNSIMSIANTIDAKDKYTSGHSVRVAKCAVEIAGKLGWSQKEIQNFHYVALLHDIGKIGVPDYVLNKEEPLASEDWAMIHKHPITGGEILKDIHMIEHVQEGALFHHEHYDGNGYPFGLKGEEIPLYARIISIADSYDSMSSNRVYRKRLQNDRIIEEFERCRGKQFDPGLTDVFLGMLKEGFHIPYADDCKAEDIMSESSILLNKVLAEYAEEARILSMHDALTGLRNRTYAKSRVDELLDKGHKGALFMFELDNFKKINDTYGHIVGDKTLQMFAEVLKENSGRNDVACRLGGDEFIVFYTDMAEREKAAEQAEKIIYMIAERFKEQEFIDDVSVSMGIAFYPDDGKNFQMLYQNADKSLYYIKKNGKNSYHIYSDGGEKGDNTVADIDNVRNLIEGRMDASKGAFQVAYDEFSKIYDFISRCVERKQQMVQTVLFSINTKDDRYPDIETMDKAMGALREAVKDSLRSVDVGTQYSSSQYILILLDADQNNGKTVVERVIERFYENYKGQDLMLSYDMQTMQPRLK